MPRYGLETGRTSKETIFPLGHKGHSRLTGARNQMKLRTIPQSFIHQKSNKTGTRSRFGKRSTIQEMQFSSTLKNKPPIRRIKGKTVLNIKYNKNASTDIQDTTPKHKWFLLKWQKPNVKRSLNDSNPITIAIWTSALDTSRRREHTCLHYHTSLLVNTG